MIGTLFRCTQEGSAGPARDILIASKGWPSKAKMNVQTENMFSALDRLEKAGIEADGHIVTTRHPSRSIQKQVSQRGTNTLITIGEHRCTSISLSPATVPSCQ